MNLQEFHKKAQELQKAIADAKFGTNGMQRAKGLYSLKKLSAELAHEYYENNYEDEDFYEVLFSLDLTKIVRIARTKAA